MTAAGRGRRGWLRVGCLAATTVALLLGVWALLLVATAYLRGRNEVVVSRELTRDLGRHGAASTVPPVDLEGEWVRDSEVRIANRLGGGRIRLPGDVRIEGWPDGTLLRQSPGDAEVPPPTLRMEVSSWLGRLKEVE